MNRLRQMVWKRCRLLLFSPLVAAVTALFLLGVNVPCAGAAASDKDQPKNSKEYYKIRDPKVDPKMSPARRARIQRDAVFKKRQHVRKQIQNIMEGKQPESSGGGEK